MVVEKINLENARKEGVYLLKDMRKLAISMVKMPVSTFLEEIKTIQVKMACALIITYGLILALIALRSVYKINQITSSFIWQESIVGFGTYLKAFISPILAVSFQVAMVAGLILIAAHFIKSDVKKETIFTMVGLTYMPAILSLIVGTLLSFPFPSIGILVIIFGLLISFLLLFIGVKEMLDADENLVIYVVPSIVLIQFFMSALLLKNGMMNSDFGSMFSLFF